MSSRSAWRSWWEAASAGCSPTWAWRRCARCSARAGLPWRCRGSSLSRQLPGRSPGLARPRLNAIWSRRLGVRLPTEPEAALLRAATEEIWTVVPNEPPPLAWHILDGPLPLAAAFGREVVFSPAMLRHISLVPVLGHELGHANTVDARLVVARARLVLWRGPSSAGWCLGPPVRWARSPAAAPPPRSRRATGRRCRRRPRGPAGAG
jgi:hypothetical protein